MTDGAPFNHNRLLLARARRGVTQIALSEAVGISIRSIKGYEAGDNAPPTETVAAIAQFLQFPVSFFCSPDIEAINIDSASFRSLSRASARVLNSAVASGTFAVELLYPFIQSRFELPPVNLPEFRDDTPHAAAEALRHHWGLGQRPIQHMIRLLEVHGVRVFSLSEDCETIDAFSLWRDGIPFVFLNNRKTAERSIFDAAHELGHLVLHRHGYPQGQSAESAADKFASCFMMPEAAIRADAPALQTVAAIASMKNKWRASTAALGRRLYDLGIMNKYTYTRFNKELSHRGKQNEPMPLQRQTSAILQQALTVLADEGTTIVDIAAALHLPVSEVRALTFSLQAIAGSGGLGAHKKTDLRLVQ